MSSPPDDRVELPHASFAERLRRHHGAVVDPAIALADDAAGGAHASSTRATATLSSNVLTRLGTRGPVAARYKLRGEIARGGMGAILEAYDEDLRRKLAMKVMLEDASGSKSSRAKVDPNKLARFLEEAQVTGQLDHPGVVPVHELGIDENGQVYFTMRLVRGRDLGAIFRLVPSGDEGWSTTRAVGVLLKVCEAMAYAHSKGVVHRDLKPANVMVGQFGEVYVMDWGLARVRDHADRHDLRLDDGARAAPEVVAADLVATDRREGSATAGGDYLRTMDGDVMGTPSYMSPEQARGELDAIGAASDVYSLGAMLYRLLTGIPPYGSREGKVDALDVLRRLRNEAPDPIDDLAPDAPRELVAICDKAMARERGERYASMSAMADDLRAFLEGRVVGAYETGALAEARKWVRRNQALSTSLVAGVLALVAGLAASIVLGQRASANAALAETRRIDAEKSADSAKRQARVAEEVNSFLNNGLLASVAPENRGHNVTVREVLDSASDDLRGRFQDEPEVEAALRLTIGTSYERLGQFEQAYEHLSRSLALSREHGGAETEPTFEATLGTARVLGELGRSDEALEMYDDLIATATRAVGPDHHAVLTALGDRALVLSHVGRDREARETLEDLVATQRRVLGADHADTLTIENNLAMIESAQGDNEESIERLRHVLERRTANLGPRDPALVEVQTNLGLALARAGSFAEGEKLVRDAHDLAAELHGPDHPITGRTLGDVAIIVSQQGRTAEAYEMFVEALRILRLSYGDEVEEVLAARGNVVSGLLDLGRNAEALENGVPTLEAQRRVLGPRHPDTLDSMNRIACAYRALGRLDEAEELFRELVQLSREFRGADHPATIIATENLGGVLLAKQQFAESESITQQVLEARKRVLGPRHPDVAKTTYNLGMIASNKGDKATARARFSEALELARSFGGAANPTAAMALQMLGGLDVDEERFEVAADEFRQSRAMLLALGPESETTAYVQHELGYCEYELGHFDAAREQLGEALSTREALLGSDDAATRTTLGTLARVTFESKHADDAERLALDFYERSLRAAGPDHDHTQRARKLLREIYEALGKPEEAEKWK